MAEVAGTILIDRSIFHFQQWTTHQCDNNDTIVKILSIKTGYQHIELIVSMGNSL